jgi:hypothetical protein
VSGAALGSSGRHTPIERSLPTMSPRLWASWRGELVMLKGIVRTLAAETVSVRDFSLGPGRRQHLEMPVMPRPMLEADGYIGRDTIDGFRVTFDFKNHALEIGQGHSRFASYPVRSNEARLRTYGSSGHLRAVACAIAGVPATAFIDTGAEVSAVNSRLFAALIDLHPTHVNLGTLPLTGVTVADSSGA